MPAVALVGAAGDARLDQLVREAIGSGVDLGRGRIAAAAACDVDHPLAVGMDLLDEGGDLAHGRLVGPRYRRDDADVEMRIASL